MCRIGVVQLLHAVGTGHRIRYRGEEPAPAVAYRSEPQRLVARGRALQRRGEALRVDHRRAQPDAMGTRQGQVALVDTGQRDPGGGRPRYRRVDAFGRQFAGEGLDGPVPVNHRASR